MQTILVEITNNKALRLLQELESLSIIRLLKKNDVTEKGGEIEKEVLQPVTPKKASEFKGILSSELANKMQENINQSREQWGRI